MAKRLARKVKRAGKSATQFRFSSTLEYIELTCKGTWRPEHLRVIWLRSHRRVHSQRVQWFATDDQGPNGADGRAVFDPPIAISLIVTLYRDIKKSLFEAKDYKYYIENDGIGGKKILAAFTANLADFAGVPNSRHALNMNLEPMSKKISRAILGVTIEAEFIKQGQAEDDDMQSTFSAISLGGGSLQFDEDDEDELDEAATMRAGSNESDGVNMVPTTTNTSNSDALLPSPPQMPLRTTDTFLHSVQKRPTSSPTHVPTNTLLLSSNPSLDCRDSLPSSVVPAASSLKENQSGAGVTASSSPSDPGKQTSSAPNGPDEEGPCAEMEPPKEAATAKSTEPQSKQTLLDPITLAPNGNSPPKFPVCAEQSLTLEKSAPPPLALSGDSQHQTEEPVTDLLLSEMGTHPSQHSTSDTAKLGQTPAVPVTNGLNPANNFDFFYQTSLLLEPKSTPPPAIAAIDNGKLVSPGSHDQQLNTIAEPAKKDQDIPPHSEPVTCTWLPNLSLVDNNNALASNSRVEGARVIGLYFSAQWCQPCRRFLPKLIQLYNILREHQKPFEVIYISNDNSGSEMTRYMDEQKMPWVALPYGHALIKKLKHAYSVKSIPMLKIVSVDGSMINENARKSVEAAGTDSVALKLFAQWAEGESATPEEKHERKASGSGLLTSIKKALTREDVDSTSSPSSTPRTEHCSSTISSTGIKKGKQRVGEAEFEELLEKMKEKDQKIRHLEEVNMSLKQTNDDLNEDVSNIKLKLRQANEKLEQLELCTSRLREEEQTLKAQMELRGWLYKRGVRGPTAKVWRRRFFRLDQGSKICYYKTATERNPQGFIDLLKVVSVSEVSPAQQDKNNSTFHVQCEGRTYQLQAVDEPEMRKWMAAIEYLKGFYTSQGNN